MIAHGCEYAHMKSVITDFSQNWWKNSKLKKSSKNCNAFLMMSNCADWNLKFIAKEFMRKKFKIVRNKISIRWRKKQETQQKKIVNSSNTHQCFSLYLSFNS